MSLASVLTSGRRAAESRMTSTANVRRKGEAVLVDGLKVPTWLVIRDALPCLVDIEGSGSGTRTVSVGATQMQVATRMLKVPHDTTYLRDGDVYRVSGGSCDGRFFQIVEATPVDQKKQQEFPVVEIQRPEGWQ